jgi:hypothetical protein
MKRMITETLLQQLKEYEGKWVALAGSGEEINCRWERRGCVEASEQAEDWGYKDTTLYNIRFCPRVLSMFRLHEVFV